MFLFLSNIRLTNRHVFTPCNFVALADVYKERDKNDSMNRRSNMSNVLVTVGNPLMAGMIPLSETKRLKSYLKVY